MKRKVSMAFLLMSAAALLGMSSLLRTVLSITNVFEAFSIGGIINWALNVAGVLVPVALVVLLYCNTKQDVKQITGIVLLGAGILELYGLFRGIISILTIASGDILFLMPNIGAWFGSAASGLLMILGALTILNGKKQKLHLIALIGAIAYCIPTLASYLVGTGSIPEILRQLLMIMALVVLPDTIVNYEEAPMVNGPNLKKVIGVIAVVLAVLLVVGMVTADSGSSGGGDECKFCHREFTDSSNIRSIARTGMCSNCAGNYKDMSGWLEDMGG